MGLDGDSMGLRGNAKELRGNAKELRGTARNCEDAYGNYMYIRIYMISIRRSPFKVGKHLIQSQLVSIWTNRSVRVRRIKLPGQQPESDDDK